MNGFWDQMIFDNPLKRYIFVLIAIVIGLLFKRIFSKFVAGQLFRGAAALDKGIDKVIICQAPAGAAGNFSDSFYYDCSASISCDSLPLWNLKCLKFLLRTLCMELPKPFSLSFLFGCCCD